MITKKTITKSNTNPEAGYLALSRFYFPLAIQAASQTLTYPLVAAIASHGEGGSLNLAGMAQAMAAMGLIGMLGAGLLTTGMVFGKTKAGFARFQQVNWLFTALVVLMTAVLSIPQISHLWFVSLLGLPISIAKPASLALVASISLQALFLMRNPYQVCLYNHGASGLASLATIVRIVATVVFVPIFIYFGLVGPIWAVVAQALAVALEVILSWYFARPLIQNLPVSKTPPATKKEIVLFSLPLSAGGLLLNLSGVFIAWAIARTVDPERMIQAYYLAAGLAGAAAFAASRTQTLVLAKLPQGVSESRLWGFSIVIGLLMGGVPLIFILPGLKELYYLSFQRCHISLLPLVTISALSMLLHPLTLSIRGFLEGKAAFLQQPLSILAGHSVFFISLVTSAVFGINLGIAGNLLPAITFLIANVAAAITMQLFIRHNIKKKNSCEICR